MLVRALIADGLSRVRAGDAPGSRAARVGVSRRIGRQDRRRVQRRSLAACDLVVWYTGGVVEAQDPTGAAYGDRRLVVVRHLPPEAAP